MLVRIVPVGNPPMKLLEIAANELQTILNAKCRILAKVPIPKDTFNYWRKQYDAEKIMNSLSGLPEVKFIDKSIPTMLVTDEDIYYSGLNFVFGLEDPVKNCCIVSIARLKQEFYDQKPNPTILIDRTVKEIIHELGHSLGLDHCQNSYCVMCFSPSVKDVDTKRKEFCSDCKVRMMTRGISLE